MGGSFLLGGFGIVNSTLPEDNLLVIGVIGVSALTRHAGKAPLFESICDQKLSIGEILKIIMRELFIMSAMFEINEAIGK